MACLTSAFCHQIVSLAMRGSRTFAEWIYAGMPIANMAMVESAWWAIVLRQVLLSAIGQGRSEHA